MEIVSTREFRTNQSAVLKKVLDGVSVVLTSRLGAFKITPITEDDSLTTRISEGLKEVQLIETGKLPAKSARSFLNEL